MLTTSNVAPFKNICYYTSMNFHASMSALHLFRQLPSCASFYACFKNYYSTDHPIKLSKITKKISVSLKSMRQKAELLASGLAIIINSTDILWPGFALYFPANSLLITRDCYPSMGWTSSAEDVHFSWIIGYRCLCSFLAAEGVLIVCLVDRNAGGNIL